MFKKTVLITLLLFLTPIFLAANLSGTFQLVKDGDGKTPKQGARITLNFSGGKLALIAAMPGNTIRDKGSYKITGALITVKFDEMSFKCNKAFYSLNDGKLRLPFKILSSGSGDSIWQKQSSLSGFSSGGSGNNGNSNGSGNGNNSGSGNGSNGGNGNNGSAGSNGQDGDSSSGTPSASNPTGGSTKVDADKSPFAHLVGQWSGKAAGAEVRFRRGKIMTLTTKHGSEFFFYVFKNGTIKGEGVILYNLDINLGGLNALAGAVKGLMGLMPFPSIPGAPATSGLAKGIMEAKGVTSTSYSYKMIGAPQQRRFKISGRVYKSGNRWKIHLDSGTTYLGNKVDKKLFVEYTVNLVTKRVSFPTWSPFLLKRKNDATIRKAAGGKVFMADAVGSGKHRNGVKVWEEYTYSWYARKIH